ncbi:hypothetical protein [uncultured Dysosmobacter sp.]|uniref:hypothetical protein n=1 Tax=uncultured Dysosmobacter sp. TaxID=2591384 RepID=UPI002635A482|nr:hypothetical protein [uncultured Dysosmobacter sp.]
MMRNKKTFRLTMLGILCGGLLLVGVGAGVAFAEYSTFTYAGERVPEQAQLQSASFTAQVDPEAQQIVIGGYGTGLYQLEETARIETSEDLEPGTLQFDFQYRSIGPKLDLSWDREPLGDSIRLYWYNNESELNLLLSCKDQLLADIRDHQIGDYAAVQLTDAVITVNPAGAEKILFD